MIIAIPSVVIAQNSPIMLTFGLQEAAWLIILLIFPLIGFLFFYFVVKGSLQTENERYARNSYLQENNKQASFMNIPSILITACNEMTVYSEGEQAIEAMLESIAGAEHYIHMV